MYDIFESPAPYGEVIGASLRKLSVAPQAIEVRVDATMIRFNVQGLLVASNSNALRRFHYFYDVTFTDDLAMMASIVWPDEAVIFTDSGVEIYVPFHWGDDEVVLFTETALGANFAINNSEFVTLADYAINYVLDLHTNETFRFSDLSIAPTGIITRAESVTVAETLTAKGDVDAMPQMDEYISISDLLIGGPIITFSDAIYWNEFLFYVMDFLLQPESVVWTDVLEVSEVAATDARPGAFVPGSALLGSST